MRLPFRPQDGSPRCLLQSARLSVQPSLSLPAGRVPLTGTSAARLAATPKAGHVAVMANHRSSWRAWALWLAATGCLVPGWLLDAAQPDSQTPEAPRAAYVGVTVDPVDPAVHQHLSTTQGAGLTVRAVAPNSSAARAGLHQHDILLRWEDQWLFTAGQLRGLLRTLEPGQSHALTILRQGVEQRIELELGERPGRVATLPTIRLASIPFAGWQDPPTLALHLTEILQPEWTTDGEPPDTLAYEYEPERLLGFRSRPADDAVMAQLGLANRTGLIIKTVRPGEPAARAGLQANDVVLTMESSAIATPEQFAERLRGYPPGAGIHLGVWRGTGTIEVQMEMPQPVRTDSRRELRAVPLHRLGGLHDWFRDLSGDVDWIILLERQTGPSSSSAGPFAATDPVQPDDPFAAASEFDLFDLPASHGSIEVQERGGRKHYIIRNQQGSILYEGPLSTEADRLALRPLGSVLRQAVEDFTLSGPGVTTPVEVKIWHWPAQPTDL
jgi:hypothetical protein